MDVLDVIGLFAAVIPLVIGGALLWFLGGLPGRVAKRVDHPDADAIRVGGWASLLLGVVGYPWVLMWAYRKPPGTTDSSATLTRLAERVADLERRLPGGHADSQEGTDR